MVVDRDNLIQLLSEEAGLSPYEARAYVAVLFSGPLSPTGVNKQSGVPRPRTYDVLNNLVGKGLLVEQLGRPTLYAAVDPGIGLKKIMESMEQKMAREVEQRWSAIESIVSSLAKPYAKVRETTNDDDVLWVTRRDNAMIAKYSEAIRNVEQEFVVATASSTPPDKEILSAVRFALKQKKSSRVIRPTSINWTRKELRKYEALIRLGDEIRFLDYNGLTFAVFDREDIVLWLPPHPSTLTVWIRLAELAEVLLDHFEQLWEKSEPAPSFLEKFPK